MQSISIPVRTSEGTYFFSPADIIHCEASSNYTRLYLKDQQPLLVARTLGDYETALVGFDFIRIHHSYLVNKAYIAKVERNGTVLLKDGSVLTMSKRRKQFVKQQLLKAAV